MFEGTYTAIVTPFGEDGRVDFDVFGKLIARQIDGGVDGIIPVGTTGESPTIEMDEHIQVISEAMRYAGGRIKVIAGTGANSTAEAVELTRAALEAGVDGTLQVTPYYNKPNDEGLYRHFSTIADMGLPVMLYNVPGRSVKELSIDLIAQLAEHPNVVSVKEAGGSADRVSKICQVCDLDVLSGDDPLTLPMMSVGAVGVVSVASNVIPDVVSRMVNLALSGDFQEALETHREYYKLFGAVLSLDTNPIPVKTALAMMGLVDESFRLPLCEMSDDKREYLQEVLNEYGL